MTLALPELQDLYTDRFIGVTFRALFLNDDRSSYNFTAEPTTDVITATGHDYILNTQVELSFVSGSVLPTPLLSGTTYFVRDVATNTLKLSLTRDGDAIDITAAGLGVFTITDKALSTGIPNVAEFVRKEVPSYQGLTNRPTVTFSTVTTTATTVGVSQALSADNTAGVDDILLTHVLLIKGGTNVRGNTTGSPVDLSPLLAPKLLITGQPYVFPVAINTTYA